MSILEVLMKLMVGDSAPDFKLPSHLVRDVMLSEMREKTVVLVFFPSSLDASLIRPDPIVRSIACDVCGIKCPGSGHKR